MALSCEPYGCGHVNGTYLVVTDSGINYILQKINTYAFKNPEQLMANIGAVCEHLSKQNGDRRSCLRFIKANDGTFMYTDGFGQVWRMCEFVPSTICLQQAETPQDLYYCGYAFGRFSGSLASFPADSLYETIPDFHNTRVRFNQLKDAIKGASPERIASCQAEIDFALARESEAGQIVDALANGTIPLRVTHNDTKLNNILFDHDTRKPVCVIDLDTIMPGSALYDYGDGIRYGASSAAEDEKELDKVYLDLELFKKYTEGYITGCDGALTRAELDMLPLGAKIITLECGSRFLADYLNGNVYFHTEYDEHNLVRCRTQFKLVSDIESKWDALSKIVKELS